MKPSDLSKEGNKIFRMILDSVVSPEFWDEEKEIELQKLIDERNKKEKLLIKNIRKHPYIKKIKKNI